MAVLEGDGTHSAGDSHTILQNYEGVGVVAKTLSLLTLRARLGLALARLKRRGQEARAAAVYPSLSSPAVVYELAGPARRYAESRLLSSSTSLPGVAEKWLAGIGGCSPTVGAIVLVGPRAMLRTVPAVIAEIPGLGTSQHALSVAEVHTTRQIYLVFRSRDDRPEWVVQFGARNTLLRLDETLRCLNGVLPDLVPRSIAIREWRDDVWFHVQEGLPGTPWFKLPDTVTTADGWLTLRLRAAEALSRFQRAIEKNPEWVVQLRPGQELRKQLSWYAQAGDLDARVLSRAEAAAQVLDQLGVLQCAWQHGDYCFNNLLISDARMGLVDFEEFGGTAMPLHDEFSLALSTHDFIHSISGAPPLGELVAASIGPTVDRLGLDPASMEGLLFHHLIWRLRQCDDRPRRARLASFLRGQLIDLANDSSTYGFRV